MNNLLFTFNSVAPTFFIILIGAILKRTGMLTEDYVKRSSLIIFRITLPALIFVKMVTREGASGLDPKMILLFLGVSTAVFGVTWLTAWRLMGTTPSVGALVQGSFRSNIAIVSLPILYNMLGDAGVVTGVILLAAAMPVYNILSVVVLASTGDHRQHIGAWQIVVTILKNPLIIAVAVGALVGWLALPLPRVLVATTQGLAQLTFPLALLGIGASLKGETLRTKATAAMTATVIKLVLLPLAVMIPAYLAGLRGENLAVLFVVSGAPTAVASFIMAKAMDSDGDLAAGIVFLATVCSALTLSAGILVLRSMGQL